jgi:hypothetical protein
VRRAWLVRWTAGGNVRHKRLKRHKGGSVRLKRLMRRMCGSVRLKRLMRHKGRIGRFFVGFLVLER